VGERGLEGGRGVRRRSGEVLVGDGTGEGGVMLVVGEREQFNRKSVENDPLGRKRFQISTDWSTCFRRDCSHRRVTSML
jgi:hypothetical protein